MQKLSGLISASIKNKSTLAKQVQASLVVEFANEKLQALWGKKGGEQARAVSLKNGLLTFNAVSAIMAQELRLKQNLLINCVNEKFGLGVVKRLKIVQRGIEVAMEV